MLSTKKLTMRRNEMKNSSIQGLLFLFGCKKKHRVREERRGVQLNRRTNEWVKWGEEERRRLGKCKQDNVSPDSAVKLPALSHVFVFSFSPSHILRSLLKHFYFLSVKHSDSKEWKTKKKINCQKSLNTSVSASVLLTCWSTPTASRPSYIMLTQPSLQDSTKSDISAWMSEANGNQCHQFSTCMCQSKDVWRCDKPVQGCQSCISVVSSDNPPPDTRFCWWYCWHLAHHSRRICL